ncbi:hypothetical protein BAUCODRAFT_25380 [Baudoinia panamericana UAMH 10762]|uniref:Protein CFT1 n=1 Tax=Baudoinia panamericana (strain UAMH 10762) TaxID=717646 RepID=M2N913_BAUPA|nr:uncharacterized protein BAUCODRAFT_25380 [Baudoinia panamericana UAMH 10762]EMC95320.1 hypothetical protein BAUCODRAFT_25380 [Baudoinia panamericana UAMH 10762]
MQCYTEVIAPTAVTHAVALSFIGPQADNLVVAKTSLLQVFEVKRISQAKDNGHHDHADAQSRLSLIGEYTLSGTVTALSPITLPSSRTGGAALVCAFKDAKLSLIEWDPEHYRISTISIHYYEGDNVLLPPFGAALSECESILTVDPGSRCAALKFGERQLAILPFRQQGDELADEAAEDADMAEAESEEQPGNVTLKRTSTTQALDSKDDITPYKSSFVLPLITLDPSLTHPVHLAFLHEYREPTFGILSAPQQPSLALLDERKDCLSYTVFTLDLEQRASTNLMSVSKLPSDLWKVIALPPPVGGALLVGTNELIHIDQSGKTTAVAVNEFAKVASNFSMADHSDLNMKLEGCEIEMLDSSTGNALIVLNDGSFATLSFKMLGRTVGGLTVSRVADTNGGNVNASAPSCVASMQQQKLFVGSEDGSSSLVRWAKDTPTLSRKRSHAQMLGQDAPMDDADDAEELDEDDLYAPSAVAVKRAASVANAAAVDASTTYTFELEDSLNSLAPMNNVCLGRSPRTGKEKLELVAGIGRGKASSLAFMNREIIPNEIRSRDVAGAKDIWSVCARSREGDKVSSADTYDNLLFVFDGESTKTYKYADSAEGSIIELDETDFEGDGETVCVGTLANGSCIVQCRRTEIRTYDHQLGLSQIIPMSDDETDAELKIVATSFCDPYLLVIQDDSSVQILQVDKQGDVEPLDAAESDLREGKWLTGSLYAGELSDGQSAAFLLGQEGGLQVFSLPETKLVYSAPTLPFLPPVLSADAPQRRGGKVTLTEVLVVDLGAEGVTRPYLIVRTAMDDLILYEPFHYSATTLDARATGFTDLRFRKVPFTYLPKYDEGLDTADGRPAQLQPAVIGGRNALYLPGGTPSFLVKEATSLPKVLGLRARGVRSFSPLHRAGCQQGFALVDGDGKLKEYQLPGHVSFATGWSVRTLTLGEPPQEVRQVAYHEQRGIYVVATCRDVDFTLHDLDERQRDDEPNLKPQVPQYTLHLLSATSHKVIQSLEMPYAEIVTSLKIMPLEVSEHTHEQKLMLVVGAAAQRGEDAPAKGLLTVFDIIDVVPEPDDPESGIRLHIAAREETKGAITALESFSGGLVGTAQGQKIMVRGLKEDGTCLPVAFLDAQTYMVSLKTMGRSGLSLAGDAWKGLWFGGWTEEPYRLTLLGKSRTKMEVVSAEFLPFDGQLYLLVVDGKMDLHVLQYDPENPKTVSGQRLLHKSTFHLGHWPVDMLLLPSDLAPFAQQAPLTNGDSNGHTNGTESSAANAPAPAPSLFHVLTTFQSGAVGLITPVDEATYRRLGALQTQLTSVLEHAAGLNPRAYRAVESESLGGRGVVDGMLVQRIGELGAARRAEVLGRAGADAWGLRSDLEIILGRGLGAPLSREARSVTQTYDPTPIPYARFCPGRPEVLAVRLKLSKRVMLLRGSSNNTGSKGLCLE